MRYARTPKNVQISRYAPTKIQVGTKARLPPCLSRWTREKARFIGAVAGNIIAIIITTQIARNNAAPIPIVRPMPIRCIMLDCQIRMAHEAAARISSSARKRRYSRCKRICVSFSSCLRSRDYPGHASPRMTGTRDRWVPGPALVFIRVSMVWLAFVLVVAAEPEAGLVATQWRAVEPLVHAPEGIQPAFVRRVGVVDDAILKC